jgi:hypothetical protein
MTPQLRTTSDELADAGSIARRIIELSRNSPKPLVFVVDAGPPYHALAARMRSAGVAVFDTCDEAMSALGRYLWQRRPNEKSSRAPGA